MWMRWTMWTMCASVGSVVKSSQVQSAAPHQCIEKMSWWSVVVSGLMVRVCLLSGVWCLVWLIQWCVHFDGVCWLMSVWWCRPGRAYPNGPDSTWLCVNDCIPYIQYCTAMLATQTADLISMGTIKRSTANTRTTRPQLLTGRSFWLNEALIEASKGLIQLNSIIRNLNGARRGHNGGTTGHRAVVRGDQLVAG